LQASLRGRPDSIVLVYRPRPYNVLAMYQVSTSPLAPSVSISTASWLMVELC
jgi:hypothetical protein